MYDRLVENRELEFVVSGKLWHDSLVMMDVQTDSLWAHLLGRCMRGTLEGTQLEVIPSSLTSWKSWRDANPETTVVTLSPIVKIGSELLKKPSAYVIGTIWRDRAKAWTFLQLVKYPLIHDDLGDQPVLVFLNPDDHTATLFDRQVDGKTLKFNVPNARDPHLVIDDVTQSTWDLSRGVATEGPMKDRVLPKRSAIVSYLHSWARFYPNSDYWKAP